MKVVGEAALETLIGYINPGAQIIRGAYIEFCMACDRHKKLNTIYPIMGNGGSQDEGGLENLGKFFEFLTAIYDIINPYAIIRTCVDFDSEYWENREFPTIPETPGSSEWIDQLREPIDEYFNTKLEVSNEFHTKYPAFDMYRVDYYCNNRALFIGNESAVTSIDKKFPEYVLRVMPQLNNI